MGKGLIWLGNKIASLWIKCMTYWNKGVSYLMFNSVPCGCKCCVTCCKEKEDCCQKI